MNKRLGFYSSVVVGLSTFAFAVSMLIGNINLSYVSSIFISWGYILLACSFAAGAAQERKAAALGGVAFASLYGVFVNLVYFSQLTTVLNKGASQEIIDSLSYIPGTWMFNLDLFGYAMMAVSTFLVGLALVPGGRTDKWLKALLMIHGIFAISCTVGPVLDIFKQNPVNNTDTAAGIIALLFWCAYFIPVSILSAMHFREEKIKGKS